MHVQQVLYGLVQALPVWSQDGLNEAQTSQAIVLPVLQALGYDVWNPLEVAPQVHSGGGSGAYIPDFTVRLGDRVRFIIEVKALSREFSANDIAQSVGYVNTLGLRWALLTNGKAWHFFDNQIPKPAADKLALTLELKNIRAPDYLSRLLARAVWLDQEAETNLADEVAAVSTDIRKRLRLGEIEGKLRNELKEGFTADAKGLAKAIELTLEPNERELAQEEFAELAKRLLGSSSATGVPPVRVTAPVKANSKQPSDVIEAIFRGVEASKAYRRQRQTDSGKLEALLDGKLLAVTSWRDLNAGIAEAMLSLGRKDFLITQGFLNETRGERRKASGDLYPPHAYRDLSSGEVLFLHAGATAHQQRINRMLLELGAPRQTLRVVYQGETYALP